MEEFPQEFPARLRSVGKLTKWSWSHLTHSTCVPEQWSPFPPASAQPGIQRTLIAPSKRRSLNSPKIIGFSATVSVGLGRDNLFFKLQRRSVGHKGGLKWTNSVDRCLHVCGTQWSIHEEGALAVQVGGGKHVFGRVGLVRISLRGLSGVSWGKTATVNWFGWSMYPFPRNSRINPWRRGPGFSGTRRKVCFWESGIGENFSARPLPGELRKAGLWGTRAGHSELIRLIYALMSVKHDRPMEKGPKYKAESMFWEEWDWDSLHLAFFWWPLPRRNDGLRGTRAGHSELIRLIDVLMFAELKDRPMENGVQIQGRKCVFGRVGLVRISLRGLSQVSWGKTVCGVQGRSQWTDSVDWCPLVRGTQGPTHRGPSTRQKVCFLKSGIGENFSAWPLPGELRKDGLWGTRPATVNWFGWLMPWCPWNSRTDPSGSKYEVESVFLDEWDWWWSSPDISFSARPFPGEPRIYGLWGTMAGHSELIRLINVLMSSCPWNSRTDSWTRRSKYKAETVFVEERDWW